MYQVVINGQIQGVYSDLNQAQQAYNNALGLSNGGGSSSPVGQGLLSGSNTGGNGAMDPNQTFVLADGSAKNRAQLISGLQGAGSTANLNGLSNQQLVQMSNDAYSNGQQAIQNQAATAGANAKNATDLFSTLNNLAGVLSSSPAAADLLPAINAALQNLGYPAISLPQGSPGGIMPNAITPAEWDALPAESKQLILAAWQARGGNPNDFLAGINAQRPGYTGNPNAASVSPGQAPNPTVHLAPLGA